MVEKSMVHSAASGSIPVEIGAQLFAFSRRSNSASTASRMNFARPYVPQSASMRSNTSGGNLTCVGLFPSGGRPIRDGVVDTDMSDKGIENDTVFVDAINDAVYINVVVYGGKAMAIKDADLYALGMNTDMVSGFRTQMARKHKGLALWPEHLTGRRWWDWQEGQKIAVNYKLLQLKIGCMVRSDRNRDFATTGGTSRFVARGKERRDQQLRNLRILTGHLRAVEDTTHDR